MQYYIDYHHFHRKTGKILDDCAIEIIENSKNDCGHGTKVVKELVTFKKRIPDDETIIKEFTQLLKSQGNPLNYRARNYMNYISTNTTDSVDLYLQCVKIGNTCTHILPGEIYVNIGLAIKEGSAFENCMVVEN